MYRNLGGWTFAFDDYLDVNITAELDSEGVAKMAAIIDPLCNLSCLWTFFYVLTFVWYIHNLCNQWNDTVKVIIYAGG